MLKCNVKICNSQSYLLDFLNSCYSYCSNIWMAGMSGFVNSLTTGHFTFLQHRYLLITKNEDSLLVKVK